MSLGDPRRFAESVHIVLLIDYSLEKYVRNIQQVRRLRKGKRTFAFTHHIGDKVVVPVGGGHVGLAEVGHEVDSGLIKARRGEGT